MLATYAGVGWLCTYLQRRQLVDVPNERSTHKQPTPRGAGLVIAAVTLSGWLAFGLVETPELWLVLLAASAGATLVAGLSWLNDFKPPASKLAGAARDKSQAAYFSDAYPRFAAQSLAALVAMVVLGYWSSVAVPTFGTLELGWLGLPVTFLWIVGLTNAYNFMDGIDGIAGAQAVVAGLGWLVLGWLSQVPLVTVLGVLLAGSSVGFLVHNWSPARIFLGDVGSAFLGYSFALLPLLLKRLSPDHVVSSRALVIGFLMVWPFVFDTLFTIARRKGMGQRIFEAHRTHLYQRLLTAGFGHRQVALLYAMLALAGTLLALGWYLEVPGVEAFTAAVPPLLCLALCCFVVVQERKQSGRLQPGTQP